MSVIMPPTPGEDVQILAPDQRLFELDRQGLRPAAVERREHDRRSLELRVSAWTLAQPTTRLAGNTVDLSAAGALLWLPELAPHAAFLELSIAAPGGPVHASARIIWRRDPALVGVQFQRMSPDDQARLVEVLRQPH